MKITENIDRRVGSVRKGGFLWGGMVLIIILMIVFINIYQSHLDNGEGIFYTIFPGPMENVYVETFQLWPFIIFGVVSAVVFFFNVTTLDREKLIEGGKAKAIGSVILPNVLLFLLFWACCWLFDLLNLSEGMFSCDGYMNFLSIIVGAVMAVLNLIIAALCKIFANEI